MLHFLRPTPGASREYANILYSSWGLGFRVWSLGNMSYKDYIGIKFPVFLLTTSKKVLHDNHTLWFPYIGGPNDALLYAPNYRVCQTGALTSGNPLNNIPKQTLPSASSWPSTRSARWRPAYRSVTRGKLRTSV